METAARTADLYSLRMHVLELGVNVNEPLTSLNETALHLVASEGSKIEATLGLEQSAATVFLAEQGANMEFHDMNGRTPLMTAARYTSNLALETLVGLGANINARNSANSNRTALMQEAQHGNTAMVSELLSLGADKELRDASGFSLLDLLVYDCRQSALDAFDLTTFDEQSMSSALFWTCHRCGILGNGVDFLTKLLDAGANPNDPTRTILHTCTGRATYQMVDVLVGWDGNESNNGIALNRQNAAGDSPMHIAALGTGDSPQKLDILLNAGADPTLVNNMGYTPLMIPIVRIQHQPNVEKMLEFPNVNLEAQDNRGQTALYLALTVGHTGIANALLDAGASPYTATSAGMTPIEYATSHREWLVAKMLATPPVTAGLKAQYAADSGTEIDESTGYLVSWKNTAPNGSPTFDLLGVSADTETLSEGTMRRIEIKEDHVNTNEDAVPIVHGSSKFASIAFHNDLLMSSRDGPYTFFHVTASTSEDGGRIFFSDNRVNWLSGFTPAKLSRGQGYRIGIAYHGNGWLTPDEGPYPHQRNEFFISTDQHNLYRSNGDYNVSPDSVEPLGKQVMLRINAGFTSTNSGMANKGWELLEILIYGRELVESELASVEAYLSRKYQIPLGSSNTPRPVPPPLAFRCVLTNNISAESEDELDLALAKLNEKLPGINFHKRSKWPHAYGHTLYVGTNGECASSNCQPRPCSTASFSHMQGLVDAVPSADFSCMCSGNDCKMLYISNCEESIDQLNTFLNS